MLLSHEVFGAHQFDLRLVNVWMFHSASKLKSRRKKVVQRSVLQKRGSRSRSYLDGST